MVCVIEREKTKMENNIFRASEARKLANVSADLMSDLLTSNAIKPLPLGRSKGRENLYDLNGVNAILLYLALRERGLGRQVCLDATRVAQSVDMRTESESGQHYLLILPDGVREQAVTADEARAELSALVDSVDMAKVVVINLLPAWCALLERVVALRAVNANFEESAG